MRRILRWARRAIAGALLVLAGYWTMDAILQRWDRSARSLHPEPVYPNDYGIRLSPLSRDETRDALERERSAIPEVVPGVRIVGL